MNLETTVRQDLWEAIKGTYQASNYRHSIVDALHHLTEILRAKSGLDGDGWDLVTQALSGQRPILKINKWETDPERKTQEGFAHILRGLYLGIRNSRSHEQWVDTKETADAIIHFISYLLDIIDKSQEPFTIQKFLDSVSDPFFVASPLYAEELVSEIPANKRLDTLIEVFRDRLSSIQSATLVSSSILSKLSDGELAQFASVVSSELRSSCDTNEIRTALAMLPGDFWPRLNALARQRIENLLIASIRRGLLDTSGNCSEDGVFGTWGGSFIPHFTAESKEIVGKTLSTLLSSGEDARRYAVEYFMPFFPYVITSEWRIKLIVIAISKAIEKGDMLIENRLADHIESLPKNWRKAFAIHISKENMRFFRVEDDTDNSPMLTLDLPF